MMTQKLQFADILRKNYGSRNFTKYFTSRKKQMANSQRQEVQNQQVLDSISRTSSIRVNQKFLYNPKHNKKDKPFSFELIKNEAQQTQNQNEFLQNLIKNQIHSYAKSKNMNQSQSKRYKQRSENYKQSSLIKIYKSNNYLQFPAYSSQKSKAKLFSGKQYSEASFKKAQKMRRQHSLPMSKKTNLNAKTSEDSTFFKPQQNPKRVIIFHKTFSQMDKGIFYSVEISMLKNRIVIFSDIVAVIKSKKFRLIMNPQDCKIFNIKWKHRLQQFVEKCLKIDIEKGIALNHPAFMHSQNGSSRIKYQKSRVQMVYTSRKQENFIKFGSIGMTKQYGSGRINSQTSKKGDQKQKQIEDNKNLIQKQVKQNPQTVVNKNNLNNNLSEILEEESKQIMSKSIIPKQKQIQNHSKLQISQHFDNSQIIKSKIQNQSKTFQKDLTLNISQKFQQAKPVIKEQRQKLQKDIQN